MDPSIAALAALAGWGASTLLPVRGLHDWLVPGALRRHEGAGVALTFDDGPHPERTPRVLDALAAARAHATFFVVGRRAQANPQLVRRLVAEGHELANHTWRHGWMPGLGAAALAADLARTQDELAGVAGRLPRFVRPPYGHRDLRFYRAARELGLTPVLWSADTYDYLGGGGAAVLRRALRAGDGDVLLMHDGNARATGTLEALPRLLQAWRARGTETARLRTPAHKPALEGAA
jgi:peptidoglycan/xylan/chitin deacetylase (PgdA/CDA1 family)